MRHVLLLIALWLIALPMALPCNAQNSPQAGAPAKSRLIFAHYMPWFEADPGHERWGWHWTMNHYHPEKVVEGRREAASHFTPLIGLYDSNDPDALECQVLLMRFAGIDGVLIDWAGIDDYLDYGINHRNAERMIESVKKAGLKFAIVYEDATVPGMVAAHRLPASETVAHGQKLMEWMQTHWFRDAAYLKQDNRPVFLVFGSGYYQGEQWHQIFAGLPQPPQFYTESNRRPPATGAFDWPQPGGGTEQSFRAMDAFYAHAREWPDHIPAAFPRFQDIYQEAGVQKSWGRIEDREGKTFSETLERALKDQAHITQLVTWNDWGEGTQIEPSVEFGYRDLETVQRLRHRYIDPTSPYTAQDLRLPVELYTRKKRLQHNPVIHAKLEMVSRLLFAGKVKEARKLLSVLPAQ